MSAPVALTIAPLVCWLGLFAYLWRLDSKIGELRK
jgi:CcmD family protein